MACQARIFTVKFRHFRAFSLVELLFVIGVLALLLALAVPVFSRSRGRATALVSANKLRQISLSLGQYAAQNKDVPPTFGSSTREPEPWQFDFGPIGRGNWFEQTWLYVFGIAGGSAEGSLFTAPGRPQESVKSRVHAGVTVPLPDYLLTECLFASPGFFRWETQTGRPQFGAQHLTSISYPAQKGLIYQSWMFHYPEYGPVLACCAVDLPSPIAFADSSVSEHVMRRMRVGMINIYGGLTLAGGSNPQHIPGPPVADTFGGIDGRDR